jgi:NAD(P)-dependent dehydrogenase (short-subunit alcohol dehydrogenase family)
MPHAETGRRTIITGAASGIGAALATLLIAQGGRVACLDRNQEGAARVAGRHPAIICDVADEASVVRAMTEAAEALGGLDALATCAGLADTTPGLEVDVATFRRMHEVNVIGTFLCIREAAARMERGGRICTVASIAGLRGGGLSGTAAYAASKGAVLALTKNMARVLGPRGIAVNTLAPGSTETPMLAAALADPANRARLEGMNALGRIGTADEIAAAIAWLLSPAASYVHGATLVADGGLVML